MSYDYDGSADYHSIASAVVTAAPLSMACWFKPDNTTTRGSLVSLSRATTSTEVFALVAAGTSAGDPVQAHCNAAGSGVNAATSTGFSAGSWQHAAAVFTSTTSRAAFINGGSKGTNSSSRTPASINTTTLGVNIFGATPTTQDFFAGLIAEAAIWSAALTDEEIGILAIGVSPLKIRPPSLVFYAPLIAAPINLVGDPLSATGSPAVSDDNPRIYSARQSVVVAKAAPSASTGTLTASESADTASLAGDVLVQGSLATLEAADAASLSGDVLAQGPLAATEAPDAASLAGNVVVQGSISVTEQSDAASFGGDVLVRGTFAATESTDSAALSGNVYGDLLGSLAASEAADLASFMGTIPAVYKFWRPEPLRPAGTVYSRRA